VHVGDERDGKRIDGKPTSLLPSDLHTRTSLVVPSLAGDRGPPRFATRAWETLYPRIPSSSSGLRPLMATVDQPSSAAGSWRTSKAESKGTSEEHESSSDSPFSPSFTSRQENLDTDDGERPTSSGLRQHQTGQAPRRQC
jgi:hypothetical protein